MRHWVLPDCTCWRSPIPCSSWWGHRRLRFALMAGALLCFQFAVRLDLRSLTRLIYFLFDEARRARHPVKGLPTSSPGECCWCLSRTRWRGGIWKGCRSGLVQFNVTSWYKAKLCYMSLYHPGLTLLGGLRGKPSITNPVCTFWITWPFLSFFWWKFLWTWVLSRRHLARCLNSLSCCPTFVWGLKVPWCEEHKPSK